jgi:hypothetical protein
LLMARLRRAIGPLAGTWMLCQIAALTFVPVTLGLYQVECTCALSVDTTCPMHHHPVRDQETPSTERCHLRNAATGAASTPTALSNLLSLLSPLGFFSSASPLVPAAVGNSALVGEPPAVRDSLLTPDLPPPRV